ncbi:hypothetical protein AHAS_Ahas19G0166600 [Arachis hypogaea]
MNLNVKEAIALPPGRHIIIGFNTELQHIGQTAGLLSGFFLASLGANFQHFSINEETWKTMDIALKEHAYDSVKEAIVNIESQDSSSNELSQNDSLAQVLEKSIQDEFGV